jgi:hypothetical protein
MFDRMKLKAQEFEEIKQLEERLWIAQFRFDRAWMETILADDFFEFGRSGRIYTRDECLGMKSETIAAVLPPPDFEARYLSNEVVQTTYKSIVKDGVQVQYANRSSIWLKTSSGWKLKFHQGTPVREFT